jgi:hypothetical protein
VAGPRVQGFPPSLAPAPHIRGRCWAFVRCPSGYYKTATSLIQVVVAYFCCSRHPEPGYLTCPIQVVIVFLRCPVYYSLWLKPRK